MRGRDRCFGRDLEVGLTIVISPVLCANRCFYSHHLVGFVSLIMWHSAHLTLIADSPSGERMSPAPPDAIWFQPMMRAIPALLNKNTAVPAINSSKHGNLLVCDFMLLQFSFSLGMLSVR